jgi:hypothetical protein
MADEIRKVVTLDTVKKREEDLGTRYTRMDSDASEFYNLKAYVLYGSDGKTVVPGSYPITSNKPRVFADRVIQALQGAKIKCDITIKGKATEQTTKIEEGWALARECIDSYLTSMEFQPLQQFMSGQVTVRGMVTCLAYPYEQNGYLIPYVGEWDSRYVASQLGRDGLEWGSYRMKMTKDEILQEFGVKIDNNDTEVLDLWYPGKHAVYIGGQDALSGTSEKGLSPDTGVTFTPVIQHLCNLTAFLRDSGYTEYLGESVYAALRNTYKEHNRQLSIRNTLAMRSLTRGMQYGSSAGENAKTDAKEALADLNTLSVEKDGGFRDMPPRDINIAAQEMLQQIDADIIQAGLSTLEYGDMPQDMTVAQLNTVLSKTMSFLKPRVRVMEMVLDDLAYMFLGQMKDRGLTGKCRIKRREWNLPTFDMANVEIKHSLVVELPQQIIAKYALNSAARGEISQETRLRDILQVEDPQGEIERLHGEMLNHVDPRLAAWDEVVRLLDSKDENDRAKGAYAVKLLGLNIPGQTPGQQTTQTPTPQPAPTPNANALPSLLKGGA